jgi:hypothetical protein
MSDSDLNYYRNLNSPYTHYHNPWLDSPDRAGLPAVYDKDGWQVFPVHHGYDFVYNGCCITQRAGITSTPIEETIKQLQRGYSPPLSPITNPTILKALGLAEPAPEVG